MATSIEKLGAAMFTIIQDYCGDVEKDVQKVVKDVSAKASKRLRSVSPQSGRTQKKEYAKGWKAKVTRNAATYIETTVFNDKKPGLAHLLEDGRDKGEKNGYRYPAMPARPHIRKVEAWALDEVVKRLSERL